jgi:hypothetical protein
MRAYAAAGHEGGQLAALGEGAVGATFELHMASMEADAFIEMEITSFDPLSCR